MVRSVYFGLILCFWLAMNVMLWRAEFGGQSELGGAVPVALVWQRILTAPDDSALEINRGGKKIGYCRWRAHIQEEPHPGGRGEAESVVPEGQVKRLTGYTIDLEGNAAVEEAGHVRFGFRGEFDPNNHWKVLSLRASVRPSSWEIRAVAADGSLRFTTDDGEQKWQRTFQSSDLRDPSNLLQELGPLPALMLGGLPSLPSPGDLPSDLLGITWTARQDWLRIGRSRVRVYRLEGSVLDHYRAIILVSRVGELLQVELPGQLLLMNESLPDF